jgi:hypothetical protein
MSMSFSMSMPIMSPSALLSSPSAWSTSKPVIASAPTSSTTSVPPDYVPTIAPNGTLSSIEFLSTVAPTNITSIAKSTVDTDSNVTTTTTESQKEKNVVGTPITNSTVIVTGIILGSITVLAIIVALISRLLRYTGTVTKIMYPQQQQSLSYKHLDDSKTVASEPSCSDDETVIVRVSKK